MTIFEAIFQNIYVAAVVVLLLGLSIFVHELGHFIAAKRCGMLIDTFSIGLGPALWKTKRRGTVYKIGWIPFGGYVALPQLDPTGMSSIQGKPEGGEEGGDDERTESLPRISPWKKIIVSISGGVGNMLLAVIIAYLVYWIGMPPMMSHISGVIGHVKEDSEAHRSGLRIGDRVLAVNGMAVSSWRDVLVESSLAEEVTLDAVSRSGEKKRVVVQTETDGEGRRYISSVHGLSQCVIQHVEKGKSAHRAGLRRRDRIIELAGARIMSADQFVETIDKHPGESLPIKVERGEKIVEMNVVPEYDEQTKKVRIGIAFGMVVFPSPGAELKSHAALIFRVLKGLTTRKEAAHAAEGSGGPVAIFGIYWQMIPVSIMLAIWFTGLLNVNLAILNLLPLPVLDGGHVMFSLWEGVTRRPVHPRVVNALVNAFAVLLIGLVVVLSYRDVKRLTPRDTMAGRAFSRIGRLLDRSAVSTNAAPARSGDADAAVSTNR